MSEVVGGGEEIDYLFMFLICDCRGAEKIFVGRSQVSGDPQTLYISRCCHLKLRRTIISFILSVFFFLIFLKERKSC